MRVVYSALSAFVTKEGADVCHEDCIKTFVWEVEMVRGRYDSIISSSIASDQQ